MQMTSTYVNAVQLKNNYTGFIQQPGDNFDPWGFGTSRAHELSTTLQWLYENHPQGKEQIIWETMELMWSGAKASNKEWIGFFVDGVFPKVGTPYVTSTPSFMHGVNMAQGVCGKIGETLDIANHLDRITLYVTALSHDEE